MPTLHMAMALRALQRNCFKQADFRNKVSSATKKEKCSDAVSDDTPLKYYACQNEKEQDRQGNAGTKQKAEKFKNTYE